MAARLRHYPESEVDFNRAIGVWMVRCYAQSGSKEWLGSPACELAANWLHLSQMRRDAKQSSAAMAAINQVLGVYAQCSGYASDAHYREGHADALETLAGIYADDQQFAHSRRSLSKSAGRIRIAFERTSRGFGLSPQAFADRIAFGIAGEVWRKSRMSQRVIAAVCPSNSRSPASGTSTQSGRLFNS